MPHRFNRRHFHHLAMGSLAAGSALATASSSAEETPEKAPAKETAAPAVSPFAVDFTQPGKTVKPVNGSNFWANVSERRIVDTFPLVQALHFSTIRLHDIPLVNDGMRLVDTHMIFGNFKADTNDPDNYYFEQTDDYLQAIIDSGSKIVYRLGTSIEHTTPKNYFAKEPKDHLQFARICDGIIRHYNEGWANGFHHDIQYWEIWNEPDLVPNMWDSKDPNVYCRFYATVAKYLKERHPNVKIGGPALMSLNEHFLKALLTACKDIGAPLDFFSWHSYARTPEQLLDPPVRGRQLLDEAGFTQTELHLNEWHYFPCKWSEIHGTEGGEERKIYWRESPEGLNGIDAAAFCGYVLTRWQDTPLDMGNYYSTTSVNWGLLHGNKRVPYYTFQLFGEMMQTQPVRVKTSDQKYVSLLGVVGKDGQKQIFASNWKQDVVNLEIQLVGVPETGEVTVLRLDREKRLEETKLAYTNSTLKIQNQPGSWVLSIRWA